MIGTTLAHYRITAALGAGGMGEVWRATDEKLGREVALKVLSEEFASDPQRLDRFEREARAVAALNHPHIVTIHSVEEVEGVRFLTMELVDGQTLDALIPKDGLEIERFFDLATPLAEAVSAAHDKSVIHRDLKPTNVMVDRDGRVKVMDFGLAKVAEAGEEPDSSELPTEALTGIGMVVGTVPYMSPEQIEGEIVDNRTDIFSLGVLLYEMAIGERPFQGKSSPALMSSILKDVPRPVVELRSDLPRHLGRIIGRCLEKNRRDRYQTARDVFNELKALQREASTSTGAAATLQPRSETTPTSSMEPSSGPRATTGVSSASGSILEDEGFWVAVLPFKFTGGDADLTALAEGLSEEIGSGLSRFSYLRVIAQGTKVVDARYLLEGSLRQVGTKLRLAVQLVDTTTGAHLWAENYERTFSSEAAFEIQDDLVPRIVSTVADIHGILPRCMSETVRLKPADQLTPYESLLHSFGYNERFTPDSLAEARTCLERAVEQAPGNADCWAMLSLMYSNEYGHYDIRNPDSFEKALQAARKAVLAAPLHSLPQYALAQAHFFRREFPAARTAAERAVALNPMDGATAAFMGLLIAYSGNWERGCELAEKAWELNPNLPGMYHYTAWHDSYRKEDYRRALELALKLNTPESFYQHAVLTMCYAQLGEMDEANKSLRAMLAIKPDYGEVARRLHGKWIQPDLVERLMDGLRKAGLEIADEEIQPEAVPVFSDSGEQRVDEGFWVAVLPFKYTGGDSELEALAEGLSEEIVTGLSRFSYLRVVARDSVATNPRYLMEGSLRKAGTKLRLAVQLVDTTVGAHLWAETYDRPFSSEEIFSLQDELVPRIVSTVADMNGVLPRSMSEAVRSGSPEQLSPYEAVLRSFAYFSRVTAEELAAARSALELALQHSPTYADAWAMLALLCAQEYGQGFDLLPDSLDRGETAARRAVEAGPSNHLAHFSLAQVLFFQKDFQAFRNSAERAATLNPMDGNSVAFLGELLTYTGDAEHGLAMAKRAKQLNPNHPGWYWYADLLHAYRQRDYSAALDFASKVNLPGHWGVHFGIAAASAQLGDRETAQKALKNLLDLRPDFGEIARREFEKWWDSEFVEHMIDGLRKAGLEIADEEEQQEAVDVLSDSGEQQADEGFWVAVLPFRYGGPNADLTTLATGLSEEIVTGLSRFSYLRVIARSSTSHHSGEGHDVRSVGRELGARYVMEGSVRQAGSTLRIAAQLVDAASGAHLWAETYNRSFHPDTIFELQDDLVPRIVSTVADWYGILPHSMSEAVRSKRSDLLTPYEALLRAFGYYRRVTPEEHAAVRPLLELAVEEAPGHASAWAMLSMLYGEEHRFGFNVEPDPLGRSLRAARRAVEAAPGSHVSHLALAQAYYFRKEFEAFRNAAESAVALNPMDGATVEYLGHLLAFAGDWERGCELGERAMQLNPNHPAWYWALPFLDAYRRGDYRGARALAPKALMPGQYYSHALFAALYGQLGEREAAGEHLREVLALRPDFAVIARDQFGRWYLPELVEQLIDGLRKAGLEIGEPAAVDAAPSGRAFAPTQQESAETKSIVVLPFANLSPDPDTEYFSDGLTDEIITDLSRVRALRVISRSSAMRLKGDGRDLAAIGRELDCRYVLEGSVRRAGNTLRMTARLVDAPNDVQLWADKYGGTLDDVFDIQERVSRSIVDALEIRLTPHEAEQLAERPIPDVRAQECYLRARSEIWSFLPGGVDKAVSHLEAGLALIGDNALLYQGLGEAYFQAINIGAAGGREEEYITKAERCAEKIFALEPESTGGYCVRAHLQLARGDIHGCSRSWRRVLQAFPKDVQALQLSAHILGWLGGKPDAAAPLVARLLDIDPLDPMSRLMSVTVPLFAGRFSEALEPGRRMFDLDPVTPVWRSNYVMALSYNRRLDEAEALTEGVVAQPDSDIGTWWMGLSRAAWREDRAEVLRLADGPYQQAAAWDAEIPWVLASAHAAVGAKVEALLWLDRAIDQGMINYPFLSEHDHYLDSIRGDARFGQAMERARREWERFDV